MPDARLRLPSQSARFHAICGEVARQATFGGRKLPAKQWKVLFVSALAIVEDEDPQLVLGLEGEFVMLREPTAKMKSARMSALIEYSTAYAVVAGITLTK